MSSYLQVQFINPFLTSSIQVIEAIVQVKPVIGKLHMRQIQYADRCIWLKINVVGQMQKEIVFGFPDELAVNMVSAMLGGYVVTELDDMCRSAMAELGNMISGNATTILYHNGIAVDITPPSFIHKTAPEWGKSVVSIPLHVHPFGEFNINIVL